MSVTTDFQDFSQGNVMKRKLFKFVTLYLLMVLVSMFVIALMEGTPYVKALYIASVAAFLKTGVAAGHSWICDLLTTN